MKRTEIIIAEDLRTSLSEALQKIDYDKLFVLTDENSACYCFPLICDFDEIKNAELITIKAGDLHKTLETIADVWTYLSQNGAGRKSLLINLGGGMVTDLGGFAASAFKRGIAYINIPTTLLGAVDAAVGGKTGINFNGLKNEIGVFNPANAVLINSVFFRSLNRENILSGYAEMLKHGLIDNEKKRADLLRFDLNRIDYGLLQNLLITSIKVKERIVADDPYEKGIRKALNLGHTVGHAFESFSFEQNRPVLHGYAVAWGLICELYLSRCLTGFPSDKLRQTTRFIRDNYGTFDIDCKQYERLYELMQHDKKNESNIINFTLLADIGDVKINQTADKELIFEMFDFYRDNL